MADNKLTTPSLLLPANVSFQCSESKSSKSSILFTCNLPSSTRLEFVTRSPSCGALHENESSAHETEQQEEDEFCVDPNFFDEGYTMAGSTGFTIWTGTRLLIECLCWNNHHQSYRLAELQQQIMKARVLELGAGVGVVGTYIAGCGGNVLLTDLRTLVDNAIEDNLIRNESIKQTNDHQDDPSWLGSNPHRIEKGWAASTPLDWTIPIHDQLTPTQCKSIDIIIASDVVFLRSMLTSLLDTVASLFESNSHNNPSFILSFQRRDSKDGEESAAFTTVNGVIGEVRGRGWRMDCLAWRHVMVMKERDDGLVVREESEVFVFEIRP